MNMQVTRIRPILEISKNDMIYITGGMKIENNSLSIQRTATSDERISTDPHGIIGQITHPHRIVTLD